ncbi:MAG: helix-turn-helix transcriptional regulator [Pseudomonadota bacterium]|nr:helix-turn-helix transcriptional regulator [Pseudomonadota bacterium]
MNSETQAPGNQTLDNDFILALASATNANTAWTVLTRYLRGYGLVGALWVGNINTLPTYVNNYPKAFFADYLSVGGAFADSCVQVAVKHSQQLRNAANVSGALIDWRSADQWLEENPETIDSDTSEIEQVSNDHNIRFGFSYCRKEGDSSISSGLGFGAVGMNENEFNLAVLPHAQKIGSAAALFQQLVKRFDTPEHTLEIELTQREHDVLQALADGVVTKQIAGRLVFASEATINKDIESLKHKLGASTQAELVYKGFIYGLLR